MRQTSAVTTTYSHTMRSQRNDHAARWTERDRRKIRDGLTKASLVHRIEQHFDFLVNADGREPGRSLSVMLV